MKYKNMKFFVVIVITLICFSSCSSVLRSMREPVTRVELSKADFHISDQVVAEAHSTQVFGIDWQRIFKQKTAVAHGPSTIWSFASIPVVGNYMSNQTANYSLYELMYANPGYDVVFYPQYVTKKKRPFLGLGFIYNKTTVQTTARLGKLKQ